MLKKLSTFALTVGLLSTLTACGNEVSSSRQDIYNGWPKELTLIQMSHESNANDPSIYHALHEHLASELGVEVKVHEAVHNEDGIESLVNGQTDMMLANPMSYYQVDQLTGTEILATLKTEGDDYTAFITQRDQDEIHHLEDLKGKNFAFVHEDTTSGYLFPKGTLVQMLNLEPDLVEQSGYFFNNVVFTESHKNSVIGVVMGDFDAAAVAIDELESMIDSEIIQSTDFKMIGRTEDIPDASYIIRDDLPETFKKALREAFISFDNKQYFEAIHNDPYASFVMPTQNYYEPAIDILSTINALETNLDHTIMFD